MTTPALARLCAEAVADLTAGGCPGGVTADEVALWIADGGGRAVPEEVDAVLERVALQSRLVMAAHPRQRSQVRLWRLSAAAEGTDPGIVGRLAERLLSVPVNPSRLPRVPCPSAAGYLRHIRNGDEPCPGDLEEANAEAARNRTARKAAAEADPCCRACGYLKTAPGHLVTCGAEAAT